MGMQYTEFGWCVADLSNIYFVLLEFSLTNRTAYSENRKTVFWLKKLHPGTGQHEDSLDHFIVFWNGIEWENELRNGTFLTKFNRKYKTQNIGKFSYSLQGIVFDSKHNLAFTVSGYNEKTESRNAGVSFDII